MKLGKTWKMALGVIAVAVVVACGGGGGGNGSSPIATLSTSGPTILRDQEIVIRFSESMNPSSLELSGAILAEAIGTWSRTVADNDTYILRPARDAWSIGAWLDLGLTNAVDSAGEALAAPLGAKYFVPLDFRNYDDASVVIGQADFGGNLANQGAAGPAGNTLSAPLGAVAVTPDGKLLVPDFVNRRVLAFNSVPGANNATANWVLGAQNLSTTGGYTASQKSVGGVIGASIAQGKLAVTDGMNHRVLIYDTMPDGTGDLPAVVVGQSNFDAWYAGSCTASGLSNPRGSVLTPSGKLIVADSLHHRVLIWNTVPIMNGQPADLVLGQQGFTNCTTDYRSPTARTMAQPQDVWSDDEKLVVNDYYNGRVLIWNTFPTRNGQPADVVLGKPDFTTWDDDDVPSAQKLSMLHFGLTSNGIQLAVADYRHSRVLIWNTFPTTNFQPADVVLGQPDFTTNSSLGTSRKSLRKPSGLHLWRDKLFVSDENRVLIFQSR